MDEIVKIDEDTIEVRTVNVQTEKISDIEKQIDDLESAKFSLLEFSKTDSDDAKTAIEEYNARISLINDSLQSQIILLTEKLDQYRGI